MRIAHLLSRRWPRRRRHAPPAFLARWSQRVARLGAQLDRRRLRPRRAQHRQHQHHRRELRLRPVALPADLRSRLHRRLFRRDRALRLRPAARHAGLEPDPAGRMPAAARRASKRSSRRSTPSGPPSSAELPRQMLRRLGLCRAATKPTARFVTALFGFLARKPGALRAVLLRLARRRAQRRARGAQPVGRRTTPAKPSARSPTRSKRYAAGRRRQSRPSLLRPQHAAHHADRRDGGASGRRSPSATTGALFHTTLAEIAQMRASLWHHALRRTA